MGIPYFQAREPLRALGAVVVSSNYSVYADLSRRVNEVLARFTPRQERYSIDESFLCLAEIAPGARSALARELVCTVKRWTGIPVGVGIGPTKTLAKIANRLVKTRQIPGDVFDLGEARHLDSILAAVEVDALWGVGPRWAARLRALNIHNACQLRDADPALIRRQFGVVLQRLVFELRGVACLELDQVAPAKKQIMVSRSFGRPVAQLSELQQAVATHAARAGEKLRRQGATAAGLQVVVKTSRRDPNRPNASCSVTVCFAAPTADCRRLAASAVDGVTALYRAGRVYSKAGVLLLDLAPAAQAQLDLLTPGDSPRARRLMQTLDAINARYGRRSVFFARSGIEQPWAMRRDRKTPAYTSRWAELPEAR